MMLTQRYGVSDILAQILVHRRIPIDQVEAYLNPTLRHFLPEPNCLVDMEKAVSRTMAAINANQTIVVYGDYDVDGTTAVATVYSFFKQRYPHLEFYNPDRYTEGYGISFMSIDWASNNDFSLIVALDCGIKSVEKIAYATNIGVDFIICDHHLPGDEIPAAIAVLNPKQLDCTYPFKELSGAGIGYKLIQGYAIQNNIPSIEVERYLDLGAVSVASDLVPILDENRVLAHFGLKKLKQQPNNGLKALLEAYPDKPEFGVNDIVLVGVVVASGVAVGVFVGVFEIVGV
jgi:single-stranded-DNA-specific exonuclease